MDSKTPAKTRSKQALARKEAGDESGAAPLEVFCRLKPTDPFEEISVTQLDDQTVRHTNPNREGEARDYTFTRVFGREIDQKTIFDSVALPLVADALKGKSGLLFTYGVTGSGKTFTMSGTPDEIGILPRCIDVVFNSIHNVHALRGVIVYDGKNQFVVNPTSEAMLVKQNAPCKVAKTHGGFRPMTPEDGEEECRVHDTTFLGIAETDLIAIFASYVEIHETKIFDLLDSRYEDAIQRTYKSKHLRDLPQLDHAYIKDVVEMEIRSPREAMDVLNTGQKRRKVAATALNSESSRGHAIFTLKIVRTTRENVESNRTDRNFYTVSQLSLVDLAGSERLSRTGNMGKLRREGNHINQSLMSLRNCLDILRDNQRNGANRPVPFRESKITQLFKGFFSGRGRVRVIICVNPAVADTDENSHVLRFAEDAQDVVIPKQNVARLDLAAFKENLPPAGEIAPAADFPITVDLRLPLFASNGTREFPAVYDFDADHLFANPDSPDWDHLMEELQKRTQVRQVRADIVDQNLDIAMKKVQHLIKDYGGMKVTLTENKALIDDQKQEIDRMRHMLNATQCEKEQLRVNMSKQEQMKAALASELRVREAEVEAERMNAQQQVRQTKKDVEQEFSGKVRFFEKRLAEEKAKREIQLAKAKKRMSKISALASGDVAHTSASESDLPSAVEREEEYFEPQTRSRAMTRPTAGGAGQRVSRVAASKGVPVVNPRHRRSLSEGNKEERWLDHQPRNLVPLGTVMTPAGLDKVKRKSVTKLEKQDVAKCSRYSLTHQQQDSDGDLETHVYKGNLIPSSAGGFQCILSDKEILQQKSPTAGKKRRSPAAGPEDASGGRNLRSSKYSRIGMELVTVMGVGR